jgi:hypothetical protein
MDTLAGKATTEEEKAKFHSEGCCYECGRQGHMAQDCPSKKSKAHGVKLTEGSKQDIINDLASRPPWSVKDMIAYTTKFSEEERTAFIQGLQDDDEETTDDPGFLVA